MTREIVRWLVPGAALAAVGAFVAAIALTYPLGSAFRPGPGYFPLIVGGLLIALGVLVSIEALLAGPAVEEEDAEKLAMWRPLIATSAALLVFALLLERVGFIPSAALLVLIAALGESGRNLWTVLAIAVFMVVFGTAVFIWGLGLPIDPVVLP